MEEENSMLDLKETKEWRKPSLKNTVYLKIKSSRIARLSFFLVIAVFITCTTIILYFNKDLPSLDSLRNYRPPTVSYIFSDDGRIIGEYSRERRIVVPLSKIPDHVQQAFIAAEDDEFYQHHGIDIKGVVRAVMMNIVKMSIHQGASTITQQMTRNILLNQEKSVSRKIREIILACKIDWNLSKDEILYLYLNHIYLGEGAYGVQAASLTYYDKNVDKLTLAEAAMLAALPKTPSIINPVKSPEAAVTRQLYVIKRMRECGYITEEQAKKAKDEKIVLSGKPKPNRYMAPYFTEHVMRMVEARYGKDALYNDGLRIHTTINLRMQNEAEKAVLEGLWEYGRRGNYNGSHQSLEEAQVSSFLRKQKNLYYYKPLDKGSIVSAVIRKIDVEKCTLHVVTGSHSGQIDRNGLYWRKLKTRKLSEIFRPGDVVIARVIKMGKNGEGCFFELGQFAEAQSALISLDLKDGAVKAMIGGRSYTESSFNRAVQSRRQPGSSFKPIIYTAAIDNGFAPDSVIIDAPVVYDIPGNKLKWKPANFSGKFYGPTSLYTGLSDSRNIIAIKLLERIGIGAVITYARQMGIKADLDPRLPLALGASGVSLSEMTSAYTTFPNLGRRVEPMYIIRIEDRDGGLLEETRPVYVNAVSPATAAIMNSMLQGVIKHGTAQRLKALGRPCAGKTGTTNNHIDAWFIGYTPEYATAVWVGKDRIKSLGRGETGGRAAAPIFLKYMKRVLEGVPVNDFAVPEDVEAMTLDSGQVFFKRGAISADIIEREDQIEEDFLKAEFR